MKYTSIIFSAVALMLMTSCGNDTPKSITPDMVKNDATADESAREERKPVMEFDSLVKDFGTITQGEKVTKTYAFTNTGNSELVITSAKGSCGCTVPDYPRKPIAPGESGKITVRFDSQGKNGKQHKKIHIVCNTTPPNNTIAIKGEVVAPELIEN